MFEELNYIYEKIITNIGIVGYLEDDIKKRGINNNDNLPLKCLYSYPQKNDDELNSLVIQMMFPDNNHKIQFPKFFSLKLTNEKAGHSYLYCLKFPEKYYLNIEDEKEKQTINQGGNNNKIENNNNISKEIKLKENANIKEIDVPLVIYIKSEKEDSEPFKQLLYTINQIIINDNLEKQGFESSIINNYKKIQLMNLLHFLFSLPHTSPHSLIKLQLNKELSNIIAYNNNNNIESIDFYFSSNCEIPCNKNDTDINILFLVLDQSIIIKVLFYILTERQIIFRASQASLLHSVINSFLKLIFPFKWLQSCINVLPKENLELIDIPGSYIFGVLSEVLPLKDVLDEYPGKIIVDCDTNEIFGENNFEVYEPPKSIKDEDSKKKKEKQKNKEIIFDNYIDDKNNFVQGNNLFVIHKSYIYKYDFNPESKIKRTKLNFPERNNIIIDTQQSQLLIDKGDIFIDSFDWKWLRKNIQLVRNPEIFDLDYFKKDKSNNNNAFFNYEEESPISPNRSFSYNIQSIFLAFILRKLSYLESDFMSVFKKTNLYLSYKDNSKKYQNNTGYRIVKNIEETKENQRSIENCFLVEFILNQFNTQVLLIKLEQRINKTNNNTNDETKDKLLQIKKIITDYNKMKEELNNMPENDSFIYFRKTIEQARKTSGNKIKGKSYPIKNPYSHNRTSLLQETCVNNKFVMLGVDKEATGTFQFYGKDGFISFITDFEKFMKEENLNIEKMIYGDYINEQMINIITNFLGDLGYKLESQNLKKTDSLKKENVSSNENLINKQELRKALGVSIVLESKEEEKNEKQNESENSNKKNLENKELGNANNQEEEYDFDENFINKCPNEDDTSLLKSSYVNLEENIILNFPSFSYDYEKEKFDKDKDYCLLMQFYLFIINYLEEIKKDNSSLQYVIEKLPLEKKINANELILKLYISAYKYSGEKHRDYPYFSFYKFLSEIDLEELKTFSSMIKPMDSAQNQNKEENELYEIFNNIIIENERKLLKKSQKFYLANKSKTLSTKQLSMNCEQVRNTISMSAVNKITEAIQRHLGKRQSIQLPKGIDLVLNINTINSANQFNQLISYVINSTPEFQSVKKRDNVSIDIIKDIGKELEAFFPNESDTKEKNIIDILEEIHKKIIANQKLIELIAQLKFISLDAIDSKKKSICFWLNCINYLVLFTIFFRDWYIDSEKDWKYFLKNVKFDIGGTYFTFNDMQYILFKKPSFFSTGYKATEKLKRFQLEKINDNTKGIEDFNKMIYFLIFLPVKKFLYPDVYEENKLEEQIIKRRNKYINSSIYFDNNKNLYIPELLQKYESNILGRGLKKYQNVLNPIDFNKIKEKKFKKIIVDNMNWKLNFDYMIKYTNGNKNEEK